ncbi:MAG: AMP-binding protein [Nanoarchaeota archaeon]
MKQEPSSIQELVHSGLFHNRKLVFNHKQGYRTRTVKALKLLEKINSARLLFNKLGINKQDKIIILGNSSFEWVTVYFACILSNIIAVPLDIMTDKSLLQKICRQVKAKTIFQSRSISISSKAKTVYLEELFDTLEDFDSNNTPIEGASPNDIIELQYTSGTTGDPKGVILTHKNVFAAVKAATDAFGLRIHLRLLNILPLSHVFAQIIGIFLPVYYGYEIYFIDSVQPKKLISFIRNKRINAAIFVPGVLAAVRNSLEGKCIMCNLGFQFRLIGVGGAPLDAELEKWWKRKLIMVLNGYGMTETSSVISLNTPFSSRSGSVGKIAKSVRIKFGEGSEILVKGDNITQGYYDNKEKTKSSFESGWFKTGDIGEIKNGYLYLKDRKKDVIITENGLKVYPVDIEAILNSIKGVKESCVVQRKKKTHAVLILNENLKCEEIMNQANAKLLSHQKIANCSIWKDPQFPKTPTGKVKRFILLQQLEKSEKTAKKYVYENKIYGIVHQVLNPGNQVKQNSKLTDLGMDSLKRVELISELEKQFDVEIDETRIDQKTTASDLEELMKASKIVRVKFKTWPITHIVIFLRYIFQIAIFYLLIRIFTKTEYMGLDNLTVNGPVILVSNHQSALDVPVIARHLNIPYAVAAHPEVVFGIGVGGFQKALRKFLGCCSAFAFNAFPFGAAIGTDTSLELTGEMLDRGFSIILFPEGERTVDGKIHEFKPGIGYIIANLDADVIPVKIDGLFDVLPRGKFVPKFGKTSVIFGAPVKFNKKQLEKMTYDDISKIIEQKVKSL